MLARAVGVGGRRGPSGNEPGGGCMARRRYVSIKEVAATAGVSFQTASKVLNGGDVRVSAETAARIVEAAERLGYQPNTIARSLVQRSTATLGLIATSVATEQAARRHGHAVLV